MRIGIMAAAGAIAVATGSTIVVAAPPAASSSRVNDIICAVSGDCASANGPDASQQRSLGDERAFSLVRSGSTPSAAAQQSRSTASSFATPTTASRAPARQRVASARAPRSVQPAAGRTDMRVNFDYNSADLTASSKSEILAFATAMQSPSLAGQKFEIRGHTDAKGSRAYNLDLSRRRAQSVADMLTAQGIAPDRIQAKGVGFDEPLAGAGGAASANRRVEFIKIG